MWLVHFEFIVRTIQKQNVGVLTQVLGCCWQWCQLEGKYSACTVYPISILNYQKENTPAVIIC